MPKQPGQKIVIIGCGNLAWHLAKRLKTQGFDNIQVYNHRPNTKLLAFSKHLNCETFTSIERINSNADFYFICVEDKHIEQVAKRIHPTLKTSVVIHTSGSMPLDVLGKSNQTAVLYPLQTFSLKSSVNWKNLPILIESKKAGTLKKVKQLAQQISETVVTTSYTHRLNLHLAAVLVNNFSNSLYVAANQFLLEKGNKKDFNLLLPLIEQTTEKIKSMPPIEAQTGPARRNDKVVMKKHLEQLKENKDLKKLYIKLSSLIKKQQHPDA